MPVFDPDSDVVTGPVVDGAPDEPVLAVDEIQGNVLPGFSSFVQAFVGARFDDAESARRFLAHVLPSVSTLRQVNDARNVRRRAARSGSPRPASPVWTNVVLSVEGLTLLGAPTERIRDDAFRAGLYGPASRALGDPTDRAHEGHVSNWRLGGSAETVPHVLVIVAADDAERVDASVRELASALAEARVVYEERGEVLVDGPHDVGREHFGFRDGVSTIAPRGRLSDEPRHFLSRRYVDPEDARALDFAKPGQPLVWPGQFVFGYPQQRDAEPLAEPGPDSDGGYPWMVDGSLLVFRRLRQDVAEFEAFLAEESARIGVAPERLAALLVGRWPNGTALAVDAEGPEDAPMADRLRVNHFAYAGDAAPIRVCADPFVATEESVAAPDELREVPGAPADLGGARCPTFAHVRKVNPRDRVTDQGAPAVTLRSQLLRRGITFGPRYRAGEPDDGERGLLFLAYQTSIEGQFELLSRKWMNRPNAPEPSSGHDLLVGQERGKRTATLEAPGVGSVEIATERTWIVPTGGGYFFSPSVSTLIELAEGKLSSSARRSRPRTRRRSTAGRRRRRAATSGRTSDRPSARPLPSP